MEFITIVRYILFCMKMQAFDEIILDIIKDMAQGD